jgi:uncharacterized membrane protein YphA (DoxX/SURF4 family)
MLFMGLNHFLQIKNMIAYAGGRGAPLPAVSVPLTGLMLVLGAISVALGAYAFVGLILWIVFLVLAALIVHTPKEGDDEGVKITEMVNFMKNMALAGLALTLLHGAQSPWPLALNLGV